MNRQVLREKIPASSKKYIKRKLFSLINVSSNITNKSESFSNKCKYRK